ncbi:MAG: hypothetical protein J6L90_00815 [Clostridia bacterium]|nr:hypothetical protein [Clostridia bacterium]
MVILKSIKLNNDIISCDYFPEGGEKGGYIAVDINTHQIVEHRPSCFEGRLFFKEETYASHAIDRLIELSKESVIKEASAVMWY